MSNVNISIEIGKIINLLKVNGYLILSILKVELLTTHINCVHVLLQTIDHRVFDAVINLSSNTVLSISPISNTPLIKENSELNALVASNPAFNRMLASKNLQLNNLIMVPCSAEALLTVKQTGPNNAVLSTNLATASKPSSNKLMQLLFYPRDSMNDKAALQPVESLYVDMSKKSLIFDSAESKVGNAVADAMDLIYKKELTPFEGDRVMSQTIEHWRNHVNPGFLQYRKSVAQGVDFAALDWNDPVPGSAIFADHRGQRYLDLLGGFGIYNVGRRHPNVVAAVTAQLSKQALHSQELLDPLRAYCANIISSLMPTDPSSSRKLSHCFFVNSGTEAVEASLKAAYMCTGRKTIIAAINAFHGKTLGALACTSKSAFRKPFLGTFSNVVHVNFNDINGLKAAFESSLFTGNEIAGLILEPVQGEGGVHVATQEYMRAARDLCDQYGACLILDEVQTGMGRTGTWFAAEQYKVVPDIMAIGKAFGGGIMPAGACIATEAVWQRYFENPFLFTTTFGGNPLAMSAAIATIDTIMKENLLQASLERGAQFRNGLLNLQRRYPTLIREIRGLGLLLGIEFHHNNTGVEFSRGMFSRQVLVSGTLVNAQTIRVEPPLTITVEQVDSALGIMQQVLEEIYVKMQAASNEKKSKL